MLQELKPGLASGTPARVLDIDIGARRVTCVFQNGNGCEVLLDGDVGEVHEGSTLYLTDDRWGLASSPLAFKESVQIAVVSEVHDSGLLVENGVGGLFWIWYQGAAEIAPGYTIKHFLLSGIIEVISKMPLRSGASFDSEIDLSHFKPQLERAGLPSFEDFGGARSEVSEMRGLLDLQLRKKQLLEELKVRPIRGVLFSGPPGTGKTMLARIIAAETNTEFYLVNGPQIINKWVGSSAKILRAIFASAAAEKNGAIIFVDEIDSLVSSRERDNSETTAQLVGELLTQMDGFSSSSSVVVIAATNSVDSIDPALRRAGRFDRQLDFILPSVDERLDILHRSGANRPWYGDVELEPIAVQSDGFSPADLENVWNEAGRVAAKERRKSISMEDLLVGVDLAKQQRAKTQRKVTR